MNRAGIELVLGLGKSGTAMARWLLAEGRHVRVADSRADPPGWSEVQAAVKDWSSPNTSRRGPREAAAGVLPDDPVPLECFFASDFAPSLLDGVARVWVSPGLPEDLPCLVAARAREIPVGGELALFAEARVRSGNATPVVAITGTNGKSTTTALVAHLLSALGWDAPPLGNFGTPMLAEWLTRRQAGKRLPDTWVLELSSFQLEHAGAFVADVATVLNISADHLDRHGSLEAYALAKARIFAGGGVAVVPRGDTTVCALVPAGVPTVSFGFDAPSRAHDWGVVDGWIVEGNARRVAISALRLIGRHNVANAMAALALASTVAGGWDERFAEAVSTFTGLPHRMVLVTTRADGVRFIEDSKGTNVGATAAAIASLDAPVHLLVGGDGKGQDFMPLAQAAAGRVCCAYCYGRDGAQIAEALTAGRIPVLLADRLETAVVQAFAASRPGEIVLLSPACASWDQFRDYRERAEVFVATVQRLLAQSRDPGELRHEAAVRAFGTKESG